jgi:hypothetical protein
MLLVSSPVPFGNAQPIKHYTDSSGLRLRSAFILMNAVLTDVADDEVE